MDHGYQEITSVLLRRQAMGDGTKKKKKCCEAYLKKGTMCSNCPLQAEEDKKDKKKEKKEKKDKKKSIKK